METINNVAETKDFYENILFRIKTADEVSPEGTIPYLVERFSIASSQPLKCPDGFEEMWIGHEKDQMYYCKKFRSSDIAEMKKLSFELMKRIFDDAGKYKNPEFSYAKTIAIIKADFLKEGDFTKVSSTTWFPIMKTWIHESGNESAKWEVFSRFMIRTYSSDRYRNRQHVVFKDLLSDFGNITEGKENPNPYSQLLMRHVAWIIGKALDNMGGD